MVTWLRLMNDQLLRGSTVSRIDLHAKNPAGYDTPGKRRIVVEAENWGSPPKWLDVAECSTKDAPRLVASLAYELARMLTPGAHYDGPVLYGKADDDGLVTDWERVEVKRSHFMPGFHGGPAADPDFEPQQTV